MKPHWVNTCDRLPDGETEVYVLVVQSRGSSGDIGYARAKLSTAGWIFPAKPPYAEIVAWLESDGLPLSHDELSKVSKDKIRY